MSPSQWREGHIRLAARRYTRGGFSSRVLEYPAVMLILHTLPSCTTLLDQRTMTELAPVLAQNVT
jgi:hypothetical protein